MSRSAKIAICALAGLAVLLLIPPSLLLAANAGALNGVMVKIFEAKTHRSLSFQKLKLNLLSNDPSVEAEQLVIGSPPEITHADLAHIGAASLHMQFLPLLLGRMQLTSIVLSNLDLNMVRLGHGRNNYSFGGAGLSAALKSVGRLSLTSGHIDYEDPQRSLTLRADVDYSQTAGVLPLHLSGGGVIRGQPYTVDAHGAPLNGRGPSTPYGFKGLMQDGAVRLSFSGVSQKPFDFRGFDLAVSGSGPNLADLDYLFNIDAPNSPPFQLTTQLQRVGHVVHMSRMDARIGGSDLHGDLTSDHTRPQRLLTAHFTADTLRAVDISVLAAPRPDHATTRVSPGVAKPKTVGGVASSKPFNTDGLHKLDATVDLRAAHLIGYAAPLNDIAGHLDLRAGRLEVTRFAAMLSPGALHGQLVLDARTSNPTLRLVGALRGARLGALRPSVRRTLDGDLDARIDLTGSGRSEHEIASHLDGEIAARLMRGTIQRGKAEALAGDPLQAAWLTLSDKGAVTPLSCASAVFAVRSGVMTPRRLLIITSAGETVGQGSIDFTARRVDLLLRGDTESGKRPAVTAPVKITGDLAHPKASVDAKRAFRRAGLSAVAAVVATPFRALTTQNQAAAAPQPCPF